jgi:hypothetical protein
MVPTERAQQKPLRDNYPPTDDVVGSPPKVEGI